MSKQPYYHRATILFTGINVTLTAKELEEKLRKALGRKFFNVVVEEFEEPEAGVRLICKMRKPLTHEGRYARYIACARHDSELTCPCCC